MKSFVRNQGPTVAAMVFATLVITALAGGSVVAFHLASYVSLAAGIWWQIRRGKLS
jgi:hypothetical protein